MSGFSGERRDADRATELPVRRLRCTGEDRSRSRTLRTTASCPRTGGGNDRRHDRRDGCTVGSRGNGGPATSAQLNSPTGLAVDGKGNVYFSEGPVVRKVGSDRVVTAVAGTGVRGFSGDGGPATAARINGAEGIAADALGTVYIADYNNSRVRKVRPDGTITTIAGNGRTGFAGDGGPARSRHVCSRRSAPRSTDKESSTSPTRSAVCAWWAQTGTITTIAGTGRAGPSGDGGPATSARLNVPYGVAVDGSGDVYVTEYAGNRVRKIRRPAAAATPAPASSSSWLYGADAVSTLFRIDAASGATRRVGATGVRSMTDIAFTPDDALRHQLQPALPRRPPQRPGNADRQRNRHRKRERARLRRTVMAPRRVDQRRVRHGRARYRARDSRGLVRARARFVRRPRVRSGRQTVRHGEAVRSRGSAPNRTRPRASRRCVDGSG